MCIVSGSFGGRGVRLYWFVCSLASDDAFVNWINLFIRAFFIVHFMPFKDFYLHHLCPPPPWLKPLPHTESINKKTLMWHDFASCLWQIASVLYNALKPWCTCTDTCCTTHDVTAYYIVCTWENQYIKLSWKSLIGLKWSTKCGQVE